MVDDPVWQPLTDQDLRGVRLVLLRVFAATVVVLVVAGMALDILDLNARDTGTGLEPSVYSLYPRGTVSDLRCDDQTSVCSYRRGRYACTYDGGTRPHCSLGPKQRQ